MSPNYWQERQYGNFSDTQIKKIQLETNKRPREKLDYSSPLVDLAILANFAFAAGFYNLTLL